MDLEGLGAFQLPLVLVPSDSVQTWGRITFEFEERRARISTDGSKMVFGYNPPSSGHTFDLCARILDWDLTDGGCFLGEKPGISADGQHMVYPSIEEGQTVTLPLPGDTVYWTGPGELGVLVPPPPLVPPYWAAYDDISVSDDGTRVALTRRLDAAR